MSHGNDAHIPLRTLCSFLAHFSRSWEVLCASVCLSVPQSVPTGTLENGLGQRGGGVNTTMESVVVEEEG